MTGLSTCASRRPWRQRRDAHNGRPFHAMLGAGVGDVEDARPVMQHRMSGGDGGCRSGGAGVATDGVDADNSAGVGGVDHLGG
jgi:hypothetical protein